MQVENVKSTYGG